MNKVRNSQFVIPPTRGPKKVVVPKTPAELVFVDTDDDELGLGWMAIQPVMKMSKNEAVLKISSELIPSLFLRATYLRPRRQQTSRDSSQENRAHPTLQIFS